MSYLINTIEFVYLLGAIVVFLFMLTDSLPKEMEKNDFFKNAPVPVCFVVSIGLAALVAAFWFIVPILFGKWKR